MKKTCKKEKYWIKYPKKRNTQEWASMPVDWLNEHKLEKTVESYFFRFDNLEKGRKNQFIRKSVFGEKSILEIEEDINWWYFRCIGAYSEIEL